jgi:K+/H+ antiporter YhaU regulatory subunit KhtT
MDVRVREQLLPGIGHRYEVLLDHHRIVVVVQRDGRRELAIVRGTDDTAVATSLSQDQAIAVAAILTGARFSIDTTDDPEVEADEVDVRTVVVSAGSPAVGRTAGEVPLPAGAHAEILAVIRDETPELVEDDTQGPIQAGDRLVVAARREQLDAVLHHVAGG